MVNAATDFSKRMKRINRAHTRLENGYISVVGKDGLIITKPKRRGAGFPLKILATLVFGFFAFKILLLSQLGPQNYDNRVDLLSKGSVIEQAGAFVLQADALSLSIAEQLRQLTL